MLEGMRDGLDGRYDVVAPAGWPPFPRRLKRSDPLIAGSRPTSIGNSTTRTRPPGSCRSFATATAADRGAARALQTLTLQRQAAARAGAALATRRSVTAARRDPVGCGVRRRVARQVVDAALQSFSETEKTEAVQTLASRARYARMLTDALAAGTVPRRDVPPHVARQLRRLAGTRFADVWGPIDENAVRGEAYSRYRGLSTRPP